MQPDPGSRTAAVHKSRRQASDPLAPATCTKQERQLLDRLHQLAKAGVQVVQFDWQQDQVAVKPVS